MRAHQHMGITGRTTHSGLTKFWLRSAGVAALVAWSASVNAATLTVNSLLDDVFPDDTGAIAVPLTAPKCTLRMAIASANLDLAVGGTTNGCVAASGSSFVTAGADTILFNSALANGTILLDATQAMNVGPIVNNTSSILFITGPTTIDGVTATNLTLDGGLSSTTSTNKRILGIAEVAASANESRTGSSIWVNVYGIKFQNARVESAGACVLSYETLRLFSVEFTNCISTNTPTVAAGGGGALFMRAPDNAASTFRPDARLTRVYFRGNKALAGGSAVNPGGGAFFLGASSGSMGNVVLTDVIVGGPNAADQNYADGGYGGGSITRAESVSITDSLFQGNVAQNGEVGGLRVNNMSGEGAATIVNTSFLGNKAKAGRGGLSVNGNPVSTVLLRDLTIAGNTAAYAAGADITGNAGVTFSNSTISSNTAVGFTGGLSVTANSGSITLDDLKITNNRVTDGNRGGFDIASNTGSVKIRRALISGNQITKGTGGYAGSGAGSIVRNPSVTMTDSIVSGNSSDQAVGAMTLVASFSPYDSAGVALPPASLPPTTNSITFDRVTISGNNTTGSATFAMNYLQSPGIYTFLNTTITGNTVTGGCGGAFSADAFNPSSQTNAMRIIFRNSTLARNSATQCQDVGGLGAYFPTAPSGNGIVNGSLVFESSILGGRQGASNPVDLIYISEPSKGTMSNTLIENNGNSLSAQCGISGNICNTDAKLDALASNGGPTQTLRLLPGSPAINTGSNSTNQTTDQRGAARMQGAATDMGAYETPAGSLTNCSLDMDGDNLVQANKEGLVLVRAMLGFTASNAIVGSGISQAQWATVRANLNANCGTSFAP